MAEVSVFSFFTLHFWPLTLPTLAYCPPFLFQQKELNMNMVEVITFLFQLGSLTLGRSYRFDSLTASQQSLVEDLKEFGAVYQRKVCISSEPFLATSFILK